MSWVTNLKAKVKTYLAGDKKKKSAVAKAHSMGLTGENAAQYAGLGPGDQAEIDKILGKKKKPK